MHSFKHFISENDDYKGEHESPDPESGAPMHDVTKGVYPEDFYSHNGLRYYADTGSKHDAKSYHSVVAHRGHPHRHLPIYRAVPKDETIKKINPGDWVTHNRSYANEHGKNHLKNDFKIIQKTVRANELFTDGNSIHEWG